MAEIDINLAPLYSQAPLERFSNRAEDYAKSRPSYPAAAIDLILAGLGQPEQLTAADIGAGTGISARLVAERGVRVVAIEPNAAMQAAAQPHPLVEFRTGTAEQTGLADRSVSVVLCCQSFHWFEPVATLSEFHRILKPSGRVALMWNDRDLTDEFTQQYSEIVRKAADQQIFDRPDRTSSDALATSALFTHYRTHRFTHTHSLDLEGLIGLVLSASYVPKTGAAFEQLLIDLQALFQRWAGEGENRCVSLAYQTNLYLADCDSAV
jgi:ubiquinone/menaquinone biosynthesis C-methylase UbiE